MTEKIFSTFYILAFGQGVLLYFLIILQKRLGSAPKVFLSTLVLAISIQLLSYGLAYRGELNHFPHIWGIGAICAFLFGPLAFLYVSSIVSKHFRLTVLDLIHLVPAILFIIYKKDFFLISGDAKASILIEKGNVFIPDISINYVLTAFLTISILVFYSFLIRKKIIEAKNNNQLASPNIKWVRGIGVAFAAYTISYILYKLVLINGLGYYHFFCHSTKIGMAFSLYCIGYLGFSINPHLDRIIPKYSNSPVSDSYALVLEKKLLKLMEMEQLFLDPGLNAKSLSQKVDAPVNYVSQVINERLNQAIPEFINSYRVNYAKTLLINNPQEKIWAVGMEAGFNNRTSFNENFKKQTGVSPSEYRRAYSKSPLP